MAQFRLSQPAIEGLRPLTKLSAATAEQLAVELTAGLRVKLGVEDSVDELVLHSEALRDLSESDRRSISGALVGLHYMSPPGNLTKDAVAKRVSELVVPNDPAQAEDFAALLKCLLGIRPLHTSTKATILAEEYERVYLDGRVLTDVRPVFDDELNSPLQASLVLHTIKFVVREGGSTKEVFVVADSEDLKELIGKFERSLKKAEVLRRFLAEPPNTPFGPSLVGFDE